MANTVTLKYGSPHRLVYEIAGDGTASGTITNATMLADLTAEGAGSGQPLYDLLNATYANQAAMRTAFLYGEPARIRTQYTVVVADTTGQVNQLAADVDTDAVATTKAEVNYQIHDTTGCTAILEIEYIHSIPR